MLQSPPSVTVITPTWYRHDLLIDRCLPSVRAQTLQPIEHIVISDGPDPELSGKLLTHKSVSYVELAEHPEGILWGSVARIVAQEMATGDFIAHLDDDNAWRPYHLQLLVTRLIDTGADFAYGQMTRQPQGDIIGKTPPQYGCIDTSLIVHRRELLDVANWIPSATRPDPDWELVERWMASGARWAFVPEVTCDYYWRGTC